MRQSFFATPTVQVSVEEDIVFLNPLEGDFPTQDPELKGHVVLTLPTRRAVTGIKVVLEGICDVWGGDRHPYETTEVLRKELDLPLAGEKLEAGQHVFNFAFIVPSSTDSSQRCTYGRTKYGVKATVHFDSMLSGTLSSSFVDVWVSPSQTPPGEVPLPTDWAAQHFTDDLGPLSLGFSSPHLTVAGLANIYVTLHDPPTSLTVVSLTGTVVQQFRVIYRDGHTVEPRETRYVLNKVRRRRSDAAADDRDESRAGRADSREPSQSAETSASNSPLASPRLSRFSRSPPLSRSASPLQRRHPVEPESFAPDPTPLAQIGRGEPFHHARICRIPDANHVRPTTLPGSRAKIVVSHRMSVEIRYRPEGGQEDLRLAVEHPITISGCSALPDNFCLPAYCVAPDRSAPDLDSADPRSRSLHAHCMCYLSTKVLLDWDGERLWGAAGSAESGTSWIPDRGQARRGVTPPDSPSTDKSPGWRPDSA